MHELPITENEVPRAPRQCLLGAQQPWRKMLVLGSYQATGRGCGEHFLVRWPEPPHEGMRRTQEDTGTEHGGNPGDRVAKNLGQDKGFLLWWGGHREPVGTKVALLGPYPDTHKQAHFTDEARNTEVLTTVDTAGGHEVTPHHH